jgi:hypothetical protein
MSFSLVPPNIRGVLPCPHCPYQIVLPFPTLEPATEGQDWWPNGSDWLYIACPECRYVYAHVQCRNETLPRNRTTPHEDKILLRISYRCAGTGCGVPRQFHILVDATVTDTTVSELRDLLTSGYWTGVGPCVHPIGIVGNQTPSVDPIRGGIDLRGYNSADPFWKRF